MRIEPLEENQMSWMLRPLDLDDEAAGRQSAHSLQGVGVSARHHIHDVDFPAVD